MNSPRLTAIVPVLLAMTAMTGPLTALRAGEAEKVPATPPLSPEQEAFWKEFQGGALSKAQIEAEAKYVTARAAFQDARFVEIKAGLSTGERYVAENSFVVKAEMDKGEAEHDH